MTIFWVVVLTEYCTTGTYTDMSLDMEPNSESEDVLHTVDDEAYNPTYAEAFPPLPESEPRETSPAASGPWKGTGSRALRSSTVTQVGQLKVV